MRSSIICFLHRILFGWSNERGSDGQGILDGWEVQQLMGKFQWKQNLQLRRHELLKDNIQMDLTEVIMFCFELTEDSVLWNACMNAGMNPVSCDLCRLYYYRSLKEHSVPAFVIHNTELYVAAFLREPLDEHVAKLPVSTRVLRTSERVGLVRARLMGAKEARGQILTFLDAHCECTIGMYQT